MNRENHSLGQKVFQRIREDILEGNYKVGEELKEQLIGEQMGVSRTPVREALRQLELEGLVEIISNKGAFVVGFSPEDIKDIYEIRAVLEGLCVKRAATRISELQIEALEEILFLTDFHIKNGNIEQVIKLDSLFHGILYEANGSRMLEQVLENYYQYLRKISRVSLSFSNRAVASNQEHKKIFEAIRQQDQKRAEYAASLHIANTIKNINSLGWEQITGGQENGKD